MVVLKGFQLVEEMGGLVEVGHQGDLMVVLKGLDYHMG
jgi:hypothetical protein